jgi:hypothetical protein
MKRSRNGFIKNLRYLCLVGVIALGLMTIVGTGGGGGGDGGDGGGGGGGGGDPCAGPVPCLTQDWGVTFYEFQEPDGSPILVNSDGNIHAEAGFTDDGDIIAFAGYVSDCYNGDIEEGAIDYYPPDGNIDYWFTWISGNVNICNTTLRISNIVIEGTPEADVVATYIGVATSLISNEDQIDRKIPPEILFEILDKMSSK